MFSQTCLHICLQQGVQGQVYVQPDLSTHMFLVGGARIGICLDFSTQLSVAGVARISIYLARLVYTFVCCKGCRYVQPLLSTHQFLSRGIYRDMYMFNQTCLHICLQQGVQEQVNIQLDLSTHLFVAGGAGISICLTRLVYTLVFIRGYRDMYMFNQTCLHICLQQGGVGIGICLARLVYIFVCSRGCRDKYMFSQACLHICLQQGVLG